MLNVLRIPRIRAASVHFLISAFVVILIALGAGLVWYPGVLVWASGLATLMVVLVGVDLVLGPLLTAIVFNPAKKSLKFDLAVIVAVQLAALIYGVHTMYQARPAFLVFTIDRFEAVAAKDIEPDMLKKAPEPYRYLSATGPVIVSATMPADSDKKADILLAKVTTGAGLALMPEHYGALHEDIGNGLKYARELKKLSDFNDDQKVKSILDRLKFKPEDLRYFPLVAREKDVTVIVHRKTGQMIDIVDLRPWG